MAKEKWAPASSTRDDDMLCGIGPFKPNWLQPFGRMGVFVGMYSVCGLVTSILTVYISSQITTIERQFGFSSSQSGFLLSCNDIGFLLTTMFFSYVARKVHIPRSLWVCTMLYGFAGLICSLAYFVSKSHLLKQTELLFSSDVGANRTFMNQTTSQAPMCSESVKGDKCDTSDEKNMYGIGEPNEFSTLAMALIAIGMIIQGVGKAPRYPFLTSYIDDNVNKKNTAMYMGVVSGVGIFGPAIGFSLGGVFSKMYVTLQDVPIDPRHPAWIGAWWIGFVVFGFLSLIIALPLVCFPRRMRPKPIKAQREEVHAQKGAVVTTIRGFLVMLKRLVSNMVYMSMTVSVCLILFTVGGNIAFMAKYLENQFSIPSYKANMLLGAMNVVAAAAGSVTGGCFVTKRKLTPRGCLKMTLIVNALIIIQACTGFILGCPNETIVGYNADSSMNVTCSSQCNCDVEAFYPMCGSDNVNYRTPCHAGCTSQRGMLFQDCDCILGMNSTGRPGLCESDCHMLYPFLISNVVGGFIGTLAMMPGLIVTLRSVSDEEKAMAVGFSALLTTLCGWFAGPVVFGIVIDSACRIWSSSCSGQGACALYDNDQFRVKHHLLNVLPKVVAFGIYVFVFIASRHKTDWSVGETETDDDQEAVKAMIDDEVNDSKNGKPLQFQISDPIVKQKSAHKPLLN